MKRCTCETSNDAGTREGWVRHEDGGVWCNECLAPVLPRLTEAEARAIIRANEVCDSESIGPSGEDGDAWEALVEEAKARIGK